MPLKVTLIKVKVSKGDGTSGEWFCDICIHVMEIRRESSALDVAGVVEMAVIL